jgi:D-alanine transaminase
LEKLVYVNGNYLPENNATVSVFDRGFVFGDGIYEVIPVVNHTLIDLDYFLDRITYSLDQLSLAWPCSKTELLDIAKELIKRNKLKEGSVYLQITRGVAPRNFPFPADTRPTLVAYTNQAAIIDNPLATTGVDVVTVEELRWKRRDIKSLNLLAQCMAKQVAAAQGCYEAWMVEDGFVTEGASSSAFIVKNGTLITRPLSNSILPGIRRRVILELAISQSFEVEQRLFTVAEAIEADEAFLSSALTLVLPIRSIDGHEIGTHVPGTLTHQVRQMYLQQIIKTAGLESN